MGAPALIHESMVSICAVVRQARGLELVVEHSSGMRAFEQPDTAALTMLLMTLFAVSLGTISFLDLQAVIVIVPVGEALTMRP